jgi:hypothetical protein
MVDIQTLSIAIASTSVVLAAIYYVLSLRHQNILRQTDLVMRLYSTFGGDEFLKAIKKVVVDDNEFKEYNDYLRNWPEVPKVGIFFEGIGVLLHRKLVDISLVDDLFSGPVIRTWEIIKPAMEDGRKKLSYPQFFEWYEYLYNEMKKREQRT